MKKPQRKKRGKILSFFFGQSNNKNVHVMLLRWSDAMVMSMAHTIPVTINISYYNDLSIEI